MIDRRLRVIQRAPGASDGELLAALDRTIRVELPSGTPPWRHQLLAIALVDMLGRLFPRLDAVCDPDAAADPSLPSGPSLLGGRLEEARRNGVDAEEPDEPYVTIRIGDGDGPADVFVDGLEWQAYVGSRPAALGANPGRPIAIGPLAAACRGAAQVFQRTLADVLPMTTTIESSYWSALTYEKGEEPLIEPTLPVPRKLVALLVGAGSIGGGAAYLLGRTPELEGHLDVVDPQVLEEQNPDRALLATYAAATAHAVKAELAVSTLAHLPINAYAHQMTIVEFVATRPRKRTLPLVLSTVDSVRARREIQDCLPLEVINAACSPTQIVVSGHVTGDGPCLYCLHLPEVLDSERVLAKLIAEATGFPFRTVIALMVNHVKLAAEHLRQIERHRALAAGALDEHAGREIDEFYRAAVLYGEVGINTASGLQAAVAAVFVTALAGFVLAGEALKAGGGEDFTHYRLGVRGQLGTKYEESLFHSPNTSIISPVPRHAGSECLCRSRRRMRILRERYRLAQEVT